MKIISSVRGSVVTALAAALLAPMARGADDDVTFTDVADATGISFQRTPSARHANEIALLESSLQQPLTMMDFAQQPMHARGMAGVLVFDYDNDGDLDIYASNGPGTPNSLFHNQLIESGAMSFIDAGVSSGADATSRDSGGVCAGDMDNDGDIDLMVTSFNEAHTLFENQGDATFVDITADAGLGDGGIGASSCAFGDIDNDGLLDLVVAHAFDLVNLVPIFAIPFDANQPTELFLNQGGNTFQDVSTTSGININAALPPGANGISWAVAMVDFDRDGDTDIILSDDQGGMPTSFYGGIDRGYNQVFVNDGSGSFSATAVGSSGSWMGSSYGDTNCDGNIDMFGTNFGDYGFPFMGLPYNLGDQASRLLLGTDGGALQDVGLGTLVASAFGWGTSIEDLDNDGDHDVVYIGSLALPPFVLKSNPGTVIVNDGGCSGTMRYDFQALASSNHLRRGGVGLATGDLDGDGFVDVVTVSNLDIPESLPVVPNPVQWGADLDGVASFAPRMAETAPGSGEFVWLGFDYANGGLTVELNNGESGFESAKVELIGGAGLTAEGMVNRSGIGATVEFTPHGGNLATSPVYSGGSFLSQNALTKTFGLGEARRGTLEVHWPGGIKNRLYRVRGGREVSFPEIPCSFDTDASLGSYVGCVRTALRDYRHAGIITVRESARLFVSAIRAYLEAR